MLLLCLFFVEIALHDALLPFGLTGPGTSGRERIIAFIVMAALLIVPLSAV